MKNTTTTSSKCVQVLTVLLLLCAPLAAFGDDSLEKEDLIVSSESASISANPIFDCACLDPMILESWRPPKNGSDHIQIAFKTEKTGRVSSVRLIHSSGFKNCDIAAIKAIRDRQLFYIPTEGAAVVFDFQHYNPFDPKGSSIVLESGRKRPLVTFVKNELWPGIDRLGHNSNAYINNQGVIALLNGDTAAAEDSFEKANKQDSFYVPAAHNLDLVRKMKSH